MTHCPSRFSTRRNSHASNPICRCPMCLKAANKPEELSPHQDPSNIAIPNQAAYKFFCDQILHSQIRQKLNFSIMNTFFFQDDKVNSYYHNHQDGTLICSTSKGMKEMERVLMSVKSRPLEPPLPRIERKYQTAKETVARKISNIIGVLAQNDGSIKLLNELNFAYEINTTKNKCFIKSYCSSKLIPVYYKHSEVFETSIYHRAQAYLKVLFKHITPLDINYISKQQQSQYQEELRRQGVGKYLLYLSCKMAILALMNDCFLVKSGVFIWVVDEDTTTTYFSNAHDIQYSMERDPDQLLNNYMDKKNKKVERKLSSLSDLKITQRAPQNPRTLLFSKVLESSFKTALNESAPNIELHEQKERVEVDQIFKKFHPEVKYNLSDIVANNIQFNKEMKKLFSKRAFKKSRGQSGGKSENPEVKGVMAKPFKQEPGSGWNTSCKTRSARTASLHQLLPEDLSCRKTLRNSSFRQRLTTQPSSKILQ